MAPTTRYARAGDVSVAYQVVGDGPVDLVFAPGFISHVELVWELPGARSYERLASFSRLLLFDKRGTGLSDPVPDAATLEERTEDLLAVMDAAESERAAIFGISEGGSMAALFAATHPGRTSSLVLYGAWPRVVRAPDFPFGVELDDLEKLIAQTDHWGEGVGLSAWAPSLASNPLAREAWARFQRAGASPGMVRSLFRLYGELDIRDILSAITAETLVLHRTGDRMVPLACGQYLAEHIPRARFVELPGDDHLWVAGDADALIDEIEEFVTGERRGPEPDRILATVLFTDIVGSTERTAAAGDRPWATLLEAHNAAVRRELERFRGTEIDTVGDGFFVTFDGPARAIRCAVAIRDTIRSLGLELRAGLHTGECEKVGDKLTGIAVNIGARVGALAGAGEISSRTRSSTSSPDRGSHSRTAASTSSREFRARVACSRWLPSANPGRQRLSYALSHHPGVRRDLCPHGRGGLVYPARFEYTAPSTLEEVIATLTERGDEAKVLAGGQSLVPLMKLRFATPEMLVDLNGVPGLDHIEEREGELCIGALVRHKTCEKSELLRGRYRVLGDAAPQISDPLVRNRGTVGGSLAHADPQGDWGSVMLAARASVVARGPDGERTISVDDLIDGPFENTLSPDEVITEVRVPDPGGRSSGTYLKLERKVGDYATAAVAIHVALDNGSVGEVGIALTGVGPTNLRAAAAEDALRGAEPTDEAIAEAARLAAEAAQPQSDIRGTAEYKRNVVRVFTERGLRTAIAAAKAGEE